MKSAELAVRLLGPFELLRGASVVPAGGPTQRAVLAMLALRAGEPVLIDALAEGIWGEGEEPAGAKGIAVHVSRLRGLLKDGNEQALRTVPGGYSLDDSAVTIDAAEFERGLAAARRLLADEEFAAALGELDAALGRWRGPALMDLRDFPFAAHVALRYDELRVDAAEERVATRLRLGESEALVPDLEGLLAEQPYRERLHYYLMLALYRAGRQADALQAFAAARSRLALELGIEPGPELQRLQHQILTQDPILAAFDANAAAASPGRPRPPQRRPARLPAAPNLVGREALLAELEALAETERLISLTGAGGSGKTVLALALLHRLAPRYRDGGVFVDLAPVSRADQVLPTVATALGVTPEGVTLQSRLCEILAERRVAMVLDNCEHVLDAVMDVASLVEATSGLIIATSRAPLGLRTEYLLHVPPLPVPDVGATEVASEPAIRLFLLGMAVAGAPPTADPTEVEAIGHICRAVDGLPLAIELAAAQTGVESVARLADMIVEELPILTAHARDVPDRQRTLEATVKWSADRLAPESRRAFARLSVFAGGFDLHGAAAVLDQDRPSAVVAVADLLEASLLLRQPAVDGQARFRMLEPLRAVGVTMAHTTAGGDSAAAAHAAYFDGLVKRLMPGRVIQRPEDLNQLRLEHANLLTAIDYLAVTDPDRCVETISCLGDFWAWTGRQFEAKRLVDPLLESGGLSDPATLEALLLSADADFESGRLERVQANVDRALALAKKLRHDEMVALTQGYEAAIARYLGDAGQASRAAAAAVAAARRAHSPLALGWALAQPPVIGGVGNDRRPRAVEALRIARQLSDAYLEYRSLLILGVICANDGAATEAEERTRDALAIARRFDSVEDAAWAEINLGSIVLRAGRIDEARALLLSALMTDDRIGHRLEAVFSLRGLAEVEIAVGRAWNGLAVFRAADAMAEKMSLRGAELDEWEIASVDRAEESLGPDRAAEARALGDRMTYREAVDFIFEVNGISRH